MINQIISFAFRLHNTFWKLKILSKRERERPNETKNAQEANQMRTNSRFHDSFFVFFTYCLFLLSSAFFLPTYRSPFHNQCVGLMSHEKQNHVRFADRKANAIVPFDGRNCWQFQDTHRLLSLWHNERRLGYPPVSPFVSTSH